MIKTSFFMISFLPHLHSNKKLFFIFNCTHKGSFYALQILFFVLLLFPFQSNYAQCKIAKIVQVNKLKILAPYKYDGFSTTEFTFDTIKKTINSNFVAFKGQRYYLLFCASDFDEIVKIKIFYNGKKKNSGPENVVEGAVGKSASNFTFEPDNSGSYNIEYTISPTLEYVPHKECIITMIGYVEK